VRIVADEVLMRKTCSLVTVLLAAIIAATVSVSTQTIPQAIERVRPGPLEIGNLVDWALPSFDEAIREADLIVQGSLTKLRTYLSDDQETLYTDYQLNPVNVIAAKDAKSQMALAPGPVPPIVLRVWGGETTINGVSVRIYNVELRPLPTDRPLLLLLTFDSQIGKYTPYASGAYVFELEDGRKLKPMIRPDLGERRLVGTDLADVIKEIHQRGR